MPRPRYQMTDADVAVVHRWVQSKFRETAPPDHPTTEQLQQWCDRFLDAAQWKQLHAVIRAARRDASQTRTVRLSTRASALLHDLASREHLTLSETIERHLAAATMPPSQPSTPPTAEQPPVQQAAARTGAPKKVRSAVAPQKRRRAFVTTKKGVCYLTVKMGREHFHLMRIYNYTIDAQKKRDMCSLTHKSAIWAKICVTKAKWRRYASNSNYMFLCRSSASAAPSLCGPHPPAPNPATTLPTDTERG